MVNDKICDRKLAAENVTIYFVFSVQPFAAMLLLVLIPLLCVSAGITEGAVHPKSVVGYTADIADDTTDSHFGYMQPIDIVTLLGKYLREDIVDAIAENSGE